MNQSTTPSVGLLPHFHANPGAQYQILMKGTVINIHGGAFMLGHSRMVSLPQISDCLARNWIVAVPNHRLCPGVDVLSGPMADIRDFLAWIYADQDGLDAFLEKQDRDGNGNGKGEYRVDKDRVMAFGTSSGGFLALSLVCILFPRVFPLAGFWVYVNRNGG